MGAFHGAHNEIRVITRCGKNRSKQWIVDGNKDLVCATVSLKVKSGT